MAVISLTPKGIIEGTRSDASLYQDSGFNRRMVHVLWNGYKLHGLSEKKLENRRGISQGEEIQTLEISCTLRKMGIGQFFERRRNWRKPQGKFDIRLLLRYFSLNVVRLKFCATTFATVLSILERTRVCRRLLS